MCSWSWVVTNQIAALSSIGSAHLSSHWLRRQPGYLFRLSCSQLDSCNSPVSGCCQQSTARQAAGNPECHWVSCYKSQVVRTRNAHLVWLSLPAGQTADHGSRSRHTFWCTTVNMACLHSICKLAANQCQYIPAVSSSLLAMLHIQTNYSDYSFAICGLCVWNSFPDVLRSPDITLSLWLRSETNWRR